MVTRRQLLQGQIATRPDLPFPPWALKSNEFINLCSRCGDCIQVCPQHIIKKNEQNLPVIDFNVAECTFCTQCVDVCKTGSLSLAEFIGSDPWPIKAVVNDVCVNYSGTVCQMCANACNDDAIQFKLQVEGTIPVIDFESCTGCGACFKSCPKRAIDIKSF